MLRVGRLARTATTYIQKRFAYSYTSVAQLAIRYGYAHVNGLNGGVRVRVPLPPYRCLCIYYRLTTT